MFVDYTGLPGRLAREPMGYFLSKIKIHSFIHSFILTAILPPKSRGVNISTHAHYELRDLGRHAVYRTGTLVQRRNTNRLYRFKSIPQITINTGILPNIIVQPPPYTYLTHIMSHDKCSQAFPVFLSSSAPMYCTKKI